MKTAYNFISFMVSLATFAIPRQFNHPSLNCKMLIVVVSA